MTYLECGGVAHSWKNSK